MKNKIILTMIVLALLVVAGCSTNGDNRESGIGGGSSSSDSPSPTNGLTLEFDEGNPSQEIFKGNPVNFAFVFKNNQKHDIENLQIRTSGFDRGFVTGLQEEYTIDRIPAASEQAEQGIYSGLVENGVVVDGFNGDYNFNPEFDYCFEATSTHQESICVPSDQNQCEIDLEDDSTNQNGPLEVAVSSINSLDDSVLIRFNVKNEGPGSVVNECFEGEDYATSYDVEATLGTTQGDCSPQGSEEFVLNNGENGNFQCEFSRSSDESYSSQLTLNLDHIYQQSHKEEIDVVDLNN